MFENVLKKMAVIGPEEKDMRLRLVQHVVNPTVHDICFIYRHSLITVIQPARAARGPEGPAR